MIKSFFIFLLVSILLSISVHASPKIKLGIDVLQEQNFQELSGQRVGLLTQPAGVNRWGKSTITILHQAPQVNLVALFGPEHGIYGDEKANVPIQNRTDEKTGLPVFSLYGEYRKPSPAMLKNIDTMVVDLQDIGVRSYTYVSALKLTMEACFEAGKKVVVLDRPNPLGGLKVDGPLLEKKWQSYVGMYPVPYLHGLTIGELAQMAVKEKDWLDLSWKARFQAKLVIIRMEGWRRSMMWPQTGLRWIPTSPYIQNLSSVMGYAMVGLGCQIGGFRHGIGTNYPFRLLSYPGKSPEQVQAALQSFHIKGLSFPIIKAKDHRGNTQRAPYVRVENWSELRPTELSFYLMRQAAAWNDQNPFATAKENTQRLFNKHVGSSTWWNEISTKGKDASILPYILQWKKEASQFQQQSRKYWLYR